MAYVLPFPWSLLLPQGSVGAPLSLELCETAAPLNPESVVFFVEEDSYEKDCFVRAHTASLTTQVVWNPRTRLEKRFGTLVVPAMPAESSDLWRVQVERQEWIIPVAGAMRRAFAWEVPERHNQDDVFLREVVELLNGFFREAVALTHDSHYPQYTDFAGQAVVRVDWETIWQRWKDVSTGKEPPMAQIVRIAFEHLAQIRNVCEHPRRMLVRQRELLPLGRVQELDATCLRDLIQRPGYSVPQKAGPKQEILAVARRETVDTAENRVIRDFLQLCQHRAQVYLRENAHAVGHQKTRAVDFLQRTCKRLDTVSPIANAGRVVGVPRPNYVLHKDRRYHPLWVQYEKLRREQKAVDDVWPWSRVLWAEFIRGLVMGFLHSDDNKSQRSWRMDEAVHGYLRAEQDSGKVLPALSISSRLVHRNGHLQMFVVHPAHSHLCPGLTEVLPRLGAELALVVYPMSECPVKPIALLCIFSVLSLQTSEQQKEEMVSSLELALESVADQQPHLNVHGLLLRGEWPGSCQPHGARRRLLDYYAAPVATPRGESKTDVGPKPFWFFEFPDLLAVLLEEIAG